MGCLQKDPDGYCAYIVCFVCLFVCIYTYLTWYSRCDILNGRGEGMFLPVVDVRADDDCEDVHHVQAQIS